MDRWVGRIALVTGASSGIGADICRDLVKHGMTVMGCARNVAKIEAIANEENVSKYPGKLHPWKCDMTNESEILAMYDEIRNRFGRLDVCINNAMCLKNSSLITGETEDWRYMIELGVIGVCINTREAIKLMREKDINGQIIQMGSIAGHKVPPFHKPPEGMPAPWFHIYNGIKWMTRALAEGLRQEVKAVNSRIRVSTISPGVVETPFIGGSIGEQAANAMFEYYKVLQSKDIANAVTYILSTPDHVNVHDIVLESLDFQV